jgi:hypothetical protein
MANDYSNIFGPIGRAKSMGGGFAPRLGLGTHRLALKSYKVKDSTKGQGQFLEAEFVVVKSSHHQAGESRGWVWFINAPGQWAAAYEQDRAKKFIEAIGACVGDNSPVEVLGAALASPDQAGVGIQIDVQISPQAGKNAGKTNARGEPYTNAIWTPVAQTLEEVAAARAELESMAPAEPAPAPAPTPAPAPQTRPTGGLGLLGRNR